ncbi:MAG: hypothetical protein LPD71_07015 [Shewanella sp.]|nr:hypothetical protein [Shewanella sp.]
MEIDGLSNAGKVWRDATLRCLQEALVPLIPIEENASCNCKELKRFAYSSHVSCYTQNTQSICDLPYEDIVLIGKTILFNKNVVRVFKDYEAGYRQVYDLFSKCSKTAKDEKTRQKWKFNHRLLMGQWMTINPN